MTDKNEVSRESLEFFPESFTGNMGGLAVGIGLGAALFGAGVPGILAVAAGVMVPPIAARGYELIGDILTDMVGTHVDTQVDAEHDAVPDVPGEYRDAGVVAGMEEMDAMHDMDEMADSIGEFDFDQDDYGCYDDYAP